MIILIAVICFLFGIGVGIGIIEFRDQHKHEKTIEQIEQDLIKDLNYYKNLSESLMQDIKELKSKIQ
jgi:hypothetical protein